MHSTCNTPPNYIPFLCPYKAVDCPQTSNQNHEQILWGGSITIEIPSSAHSSKYVSPHTVGMYQCWYTWQQKTPPKWLLTKFSWFPGCIVFSPTPPPLFYSPPSFSSPVPFLSSPSSNPFSPSYLHFHSLSSVQNTTNYYNLRHNYFPIQNQNFSNDCDTIKS